MRIVLVNAPDEDIHAQRVNILIEQALKQLCLHRSAFECIVITGKKHPGRFSFFEKSRRKQEIKQLKPDLVVYASPSNFLTIKPLKVVVLITHLENISQNNLLKKQILKSTAVVTDSVQLKKEIINLYKINERCIYIVKLIEEKIDTSSSTNQSIREKFTSGKEYFFYGGSIDRSGEWELVLQAFSQFKKWQQSGLQLVLASPMQAGYQNNFQEKLDAYKFRQDVICLNKLTPAEKHPLAAAAFAVMAAAETFDGRMNIINSFRSGVAVIASKTAVAKELCGEAALYADFKNPEDLSQKMIALYKNEDAYIRLIEMGQVLSSRFDYNQMLDELHESLQAVIKQ